MKVTKKDKYIYVRTKGGAMYQLKEDEHGLHIYRTDLGGDTIRLEPFANNHILLHDGKTRRKCQKKN